MCSNVFKINWNYGGKVLKYFFLDLGEEKTDENDDRDFEMLLHFEAATVAE